MVREVPAGVNVHESLFDERSADVAGTEKVTAEHVHVEVGREAFGLGVPSASSIR
jgi:hypothetical protein